MKSENSFIEELESRAREQRRLAETELIPGWARGLGDWMAVNPWRVMVPGAGIAYLVLRIMLRAEFREFILGLFGGFAR